MVGTRFTSCIRAVTLTELIISTMVVGIIMLGVMSADFAIRKQNESAFNSSSSAIRGQVILDHIMQKAGQAVGSQADQGVSIAPGGNTDTFCVRTTMTGPIWACYTIVAGNLRFCQRATTGVCTGSDENLGALSIAGGTDVTNAASGVSVSFTQSTAVGAQQMLFSTKVIVPGNAATDPTKSLTASVSPSAHSM